MAEGKNSLIEAMLAVQCELPAIPKDAHGHGYDYVSLDRLLGVIRPLLCKHGLVLSQWPAVASQPGNIAIETRVHHVSGQHMKQIGELPILNENKRMNETQAAGAAYTYLRRYAVAALFGVVSDEDTDAADLAVLSNVDQEEARAILGTTAVEFPGVALALLTGYNHEKHVMNAMKKLGYAGIPGKPDERLRAFEQLRARKVNGHVE